MEGMGFEPRKPGISDPDLHSHMILPLASLLTSHLSIRCPSIQPAASLPSTLRPSSPSSGFHVQGQLPPGGVSSTHCPASVSPPTLAHHSPTLHGLLSCWCPLVDWSFRESEDFVLLALWHTAGAQQVLSVWMGDAWLVELVEWLSGWMFEWKDG